MAKAMRVELIDSMGSDLTIVNAARVSFDKAGEWECEDTWGLLKVKYPDKSYTFLREESGYGTWSVLKDSDTKLIKYLANHNHFTPFTHAVITLRETVPIFVARQRFKHVVGFTYNEISRRYVDDKPEFYTPEFWRGRPEGSVKQGSSEKIVETFPDHGLWTNAETKIDEAYENFLNIAEHLYSDMLHAGIAPEQARMILPQSMYTSYYVTGSLHAFARAYKLRIDPHAQKEIQELAENWDEIIRPLFPVAWSSLVDL